MIARWFRIKDSWRSPEFETLWNSKRSNWITFAGLSKGNHSHCKDDYWLFVFWESDVFVYILNTSCHRSAVISVQWAAEMTPSRWSCWWTSHSTRCNVEWREQPENSARLSVNITFKSVWLHIQYVCLSGALSVCLSVGPSKALSVCVCVQVCLSNDLQLCLSVCLTASLCLSASLQLCLSTVSATRCVYKSVCLRFCLSVRSITLARHILVLTSHILGSKK